MRTTIKPGTLAALLPVLFTGCGSPPTDTASAPDAILVNAAFYTLDPVQPKAEAIAVRDGVIVAVGDAAAISATAGPDTRVTDLEGQTVLPGFHDMHVHPLFAGLSHLRCVIPQGANMDDFLAQVSRCADSGTDEEWVTGGQWDVSALGQSPSKELL